MTDMDAGRLPAKATCKSWEKKGLSVKNDIIKSCMAPKPKEDD
jgi:hypothetical protein